MLVDLVRAGMAALPVSVGVAGRNRDLVFGAIDRFGLRIPREIKTSLGTVRVDPSHGPERLLAYCFENVFRNYCESPLGHLITQQPRGSVFLDVGANLGMYSFLARSHGLLAVPVEPDPRHAAFLQRNFERVVTSALSDSPGELPLYYEARNPGATSLFPLDSYARGEVVPVETFAAVAERGDFGDLAAVSLIKIDVEGLEAEVVRGMTPFLTEHKPQIWCEVRGEASGRATGSYRRVVEQLTALGYRVFDPEPVGPMEGRGVFDLHFQLAGR